MSVLVTPGNVRSALAVTRSLGRRAIPTVVADDCVSSLAGVSRYCRASIRVPSPAMSEGAFVSAIRHEVARGNHRVIMPADDVTLSVIARARQEFDGMAVLPFPDFETVQIAHDKGALMSLAEERGIPVPKTVVLSDPSELTSAIRRVGLPAVVKARSSRLYVDGQWRSGGGVYYVHTPADLDKAYRAIREMSALSVIQEYIPGDGRGVFTLMNHGRLRAAFAHRRIREKPPSGGVSVLSESVRLDAQVLEYTERLLEALKWHGVAMAEFKRDARDGVTKLLEINGRFWGSLQLAVDAGVDFPYLLYRMATDGDVEPVFTYRVGVRLRWWLGDLDWLLLRLRERERPATRIGALLEFLKPAGKLTRSEVLRRDDPRPALLELRQYASEALHGALGRFAHRAMS